MKKRFALLVLVALVLAFVLVPAHYQPAVDSPGLSCFCNDAFSPFLAVDNPVFHLDHAPEWRIASFSPTVAHALPKALPSSTGLRAPPA
jgi:hypothetical protein